MERSTKWRGIGLALILAFCVCSIIPTFVGPKSLPSWFSWAFKKRINLGLDLQGGLHVVYDIDLDKAVDDKASEIKRDLESKFTDDKIKGTVKTPAAPVGALTVVVEDATKVDEVKKLLKADYNDSVIDRDCAPTDAKGSICVRVSSDYADGIKKAALHNAVTTIRERIDEKGIAEATVIEKGDDIIVELPGLDQDRIDATKDIIARTAKLEFKLILDGEPYMRDLFAFVSSDSAAKALEIKTDTDPWTSEKDGKKHDDWYLSATDRDELINVDEARKLGCFDATKVSDGKITCKLTGRYVMERYLAALGAKDPKYKIADDRQIGYEIVDRGEVGKKPYWRTYYMDRAIRLSGSAITKAAVNFDPQTNQPLVIVEFNRYGGRVFGDLTSQNIGRKFATILDDKVKSAPVVNDAIRGGSASITMGGADAKVKEREANDLVAVLKTGSLPAPLHESSHAQIGPTLGRDAVDKAKLSFGLGILLVVMIMIYIYRWSGWFAIGAVAMNILIMLMLMTVLGATLTLPGIAALVLTVGMAVDGNILIYERIRDELLIGKSVRGAVELGFARAFTAILDGHMTTAAAGWVLLQYGSGPIKGFAVMLLLGIGTTLFTNIWVGRLFFDWYVANKKGQSATISI